MSEIANAILDAAERRIRDAGYSGFSYRELATDVGIKSSSVHYHFPSKERLAAAVARRYTDRFNEAVAAEREAGFGPVEAWQRVFRHAVRQDGRMCLCGALGAAARDLPKEVLTEVRRFFKLGLETLASAGLSPVDAMRLLSTLEGAMLVANTLGDASVFDLVISEAA